MVDIEHSHILHLYKTFLSPISDLDCGAKCSAYNEHHVPFCCDTRHVIPLAYCSEWDYLSENADMWERISCNEILDFEHLKEKIPPDQVMIKCQGHQKCQREYRSITCRSFPFFPYIDQKGNFIGLSYYWEYEDRCWIINHLDCVSPRFRDEFVFAYEYIFAHSNHEFANFRHQSIIMRRVFGRKKRAIPLISRFPSPQLRYYKISPHNGRMRRVGVDSFAKHGNYNLVDKLPFADEI